MTGKNLSSSTVAALILPALVLAACAAQETWVPTRDEEQVRTIALQFTRALASHDYEAAYAMTSGEYRRTTDVEQLRESFEAIVPDDWGATEPIEVAQVITDWPGRQLSDLGRAYVSIYGDVYSEALFVVVTSESGQARVGGVEFGRP